MPMIPYGPWHPDRGIFFPGVVGEARNCIRVGTGFRPLASLRDFQAGGIDTWPSFLSMFKANDNQTYIIAGDTSKLYELNAGTMTFADVSKSGGYTTGETERWRAVQWGNELVMTNYVDAMQVRDLAGAPTFGDLSVDAPKARFIAVCGPYVVLGNTYDPVDGAVPYRARWCGIEDIRAWVPAAETTADWQDIPDLGHMTGLTGGRQLTVLFERGVVVGSLIGAPMALRFDRVEGAQGCLIANSVVQFRGSTYYLSRDGFQRFDGQRSVPIGQMKVNRWFFKDSLFDKLSRMSVAVDQQQKIITWLYCGSGSDGITPNHMLIYNYDEDEFTWAEVKAQMIGSFATPGYNIDNIDSFAPSGNVDLMPAPFDDPFWTGGVPLFGAFVENRLFTMTGDPMTAVIDTNFQTFDPVRRALLTEIFDVIEGNGEVSCMVFTLDNKSHTPRSWPLTAENKLGFFPVRAEGRWHSIRAFIGSYWVLASGLDVTVRPLGVR